MSLVISSGKSGHFLPAPFDKFKLRERTWLWYWLIDRDYIDAEKEPEGPAHRIQIMTRVINESHKKERLVNSISAEVKDMLLPPEHIEWVKSGGDRLSIWILHNLRLSKSYEKLAGRLSNDEVSIIGSPYERFQTALDLCTWTADEKERFLADMRQDWGKVVAFFLPYDFPKAEDEIQVEWAWRYLTDQRVVPRGKNPINHKDRYLWVVASLDAHLGAVDHPSVMKIFMDKMKKAWSQYKYRNSDGGKKPINLSLSLKAIARLEWLEKYHETTRVGVIESLLKEACITLGRED